MKRSFLHLPSRRGFTLTELLVVITIIAVLMVLGMGVYSRMQNAAGNTTCVSNLRQNYAVYMQQTADNDNTIPLSRDSSSWTEKYHTSLGGDWSMPSGGERAAAVVGCPVHRRKIGRTVKIKGQGYGPNHRTFGINLRLTDNNVNKDKTAMPKYPSFAYPSQTALITDGWLEEKGTPNGGVSYEKLPDTVHDNRTNILFLDGHVEDWTKDQLSSVNNGGAIKGDGSKTSLFWIGF
jgi:prepilin-type N-terminal cleavage/methylation domain-containing protein/prepilin-type processing-associated H-X9-DG protein